MSKAPDKSKPAEAVQANGEWPKILQRFVNEKSPCPQDYLPRRVRRRFNGEVVTLWQGYVHVDDVDGWVENVRLKFFLNRWKSKRDPSVVPTTDDIYTIMKEADAEEKDQESKMPFHVERMAQNISRNGIQEPVILFFAGSGKGELWDGNRRFFGTKHIMKSPDFTAYREQAKWLPAQVVTPSGDPGQDLRIKQFILAEMNFVEKDHIPWPAYVRAEQIWLKYQKAMKDEPNDVVLSRQTKEKLAKEYGLKTWRVADRWIKMYDLAAKFKEYHEEEHNRDQVDVDLKIQEKFEYFDEMSKAGVWGSLKDDPDARDEVFRWLWDDKFKAFPDVRKVPQILLDPVARKQANSDDAEGVKKAIATIIANDPTRVKDKDAANEKVKQFAEWLDSFRRAEFKELNAESLEKLQQILADVTKILESLQKKGRKT